MHRAMVGGSGFAIISFVVGFAKHQAANTEFEVRAPVQSSQTRLASSHRDPVGLI